MMALVFMSLLSPTIRLFPNDGIALGGKVAWLGPLAAVIPAMLYLFVMTRFMKSRGEGDGLAEQNDRSVGKRAGQVVSLLLSIWLIIYSGFTLRAGAERLLSAIYEDGSLFLLMLAFLAAAGFAASGSVKSLAACSGVFTGVVTGVLVFAVLFSLRDVKIENLLPLTAENAEGAIVSAVPVINVISIQTYFMFLYGDVDKGSESGRMCAGWMLAQMCAILCVTAVTIGCLSAELAERIQNPSFVVVRNIRIFTIIERIEAALVAIWFLTDFFLLASMLRVSAALVSRSFGKSVSPRWTAACSAGALLCAYLISGDAFSLVPISAEIIPAIHMTVVLALIPFILTVGAVRKRI